MKIKTTELTARALDWAVGVAVGYTPTISGGNVIVGDEDEQGITHLNIYSPTTNWGQLGPYTELIAWVETGAGFMICLNDPESKKTAGDPEFKCFGNADHEQFEIALCQAIVDLYIGDQVDVPEGVGV